MAQTTDKNKVKQMIDTRTTAMLVTHDRQGGLVSRPMTTQQPEPDGDVWFFVSSDADVIDEIKTNNEVNIAYMSDDAYLSMNGVAEIVDDNDKKQDLWYDDLAKWFDGQNPESPDVMLIKVSGDTARYWTAGKDSAPTEEIIRYA